MTKIILEKNDTPCI